MDGQQRRALVDLVRSAVATDLDAIAVEQARLRQEVAALRALIGLPLEQARRGERRPMVAALRAAGLSNAAAAALLNVTRETVRADVRELGLPPARESVGLDGATRNYTPSDSRSAASQG